VFKRADRCCSCGAVVEVREVKREELLDLSENDAV